MNAFPLDAFKTIIAAWKEKKFSLEVVVAVGTVIAWVAGGLQKSDAAPATTPGDTTPELSLVLNSVALPSSEDAIAYMESLVETHESNNLMELHSGVGKSLLSWLIRVALQWAMAGAIS